MSPSLLSVNVGMPKDVAWQGKTVHTGIWKRPVAGPRLARRLNLDGDGQGDLNGHGGEQRAVLVYQAESYDYWRRYFDNAGFEFGAFGENFTIDGLGDDEVCIGDRYRIGDAEFEVTQPRVTCFRLGMRLGRPQLPSLLVARRRPGFYLRVIREGFVQAGDELVRTVRGPHELSVADADALLYLPNRKHEQLEAAVAIPALSPGWRQSFRDLLAPDTAAAPEPGWSGFAPLRVVDLVPESSTITSVYLAPVDGSALPEPKPGQYLTLRAAQAGDPAPIRSYSLSSAPGAATYRISVKRETDGLVSTFLHTRLTVGDVLDVAAPRGEFVLAPGSEPVLLISAGVGVTPVLSMLNRLAAEQSTREVWWLHTACDAAQHAFADEANRLVESLPHAHLAVFYTADAAVPAGVVRGRPSTEALAALGLPTDATAYICGPERFMVDMQKALVSVGIDPGRVHTELFGALSAINPGVLQTPTVRPHQPAGEPGSGPLITFARSGLAVRWREADATLLELAEACDVPTRFACRSGVCHTCATPLLSGRVSYGPEPLEPPAAGQVLVCCAHPDTDVVLDQ